MTAEHSCQEEGQGGCSGTNGLITRAQSSPSMCKALQENRTAPPWWVWVRRGLGREEAADCFGQVKVWAGKWGDKEEMGVLGALHGGRVRRGQLLKEGACMQDREAESRGWGCWRQI